MPQAFGPVAVGFIASTRRFEGRPRLRRSGAKGWSPDLMLIDDLHDLMRKPSTASSSLSLSLNL